MGRKAFARALGATLVLLLAGRAEAATIKGTVRDKVGRPGRPVAGASIYVWQHGGGFSRTVHSGPDGYYETDAPEGSTCNLGCNKTDQPGYKPELSTGTADNVDLSTSEVVVNFDLDAAAPSPVRPRGVATAGGTAAPRTAPRSGAAPAPAPAPSAPSATPSGSPYDAKVVAVSSPAHLAPGEKGTVTIVYKNTGSFSWDDRTHVGLSNSHFSEPARGGTSPLEGSGWLSHDRPAATGATAPGGEATVHFEITAPATSGVQMVYLELVEDGVSWFEGHGDDVHFHVYVGGSASSPGPSGGGAPSKTLSRVGVDGNQPINDDGTIALDAAKIAASGAKVCRVNFVRGAWSGPTDSTVHAGHTWFGAADAVVDSLGKKGVSVYGLLNDQLLEGSGDFLRDHRDDAKARDWIEKFAAACEATVGHFKDRVRVFEIMNEPNDWAGGSTARVAPTWMALILQRVYTLVKTSHAGDASWQVTLCSGPLFSFSDGLGDDYLKSVYHAGRHDHEWDDLRAKASTFPLDGVGYHIYVLEGSGDRPGDVASVYKKHLDAIDDVLRAEDPEAGSKKIWISEFGWNSNLGETHQSEMLTAGFDALLGDGRVALAVWFCFGDFGSEGYGLTSGGHEKEALSTFKAIAGAH